MSKYQIGDQTFRTKHLVDARASEILNGNEIGVPLTGAASAFVLGLFAHYPSPARELEKLQGREISDVEVGIKRGDDWAHRVFILVFDDGSRDDFSIEKAIRNMRSIDVAA